jgi:heme/copper-type cytochrome/quinol oxidase subunit 2
MSDTQMLLILGLAMLTLVGFVVWSVWDMRRSANRQRAGDKT